MSFLLRKLHKYGPYLELWTWYRSVTCPSGSSFHAQSWLKNPVDKTTFILITIIDTICVISVKIKSFGTLSSNKNKYLFQIIPSLRMILFIRQENQVIKTNILLLQTVTCINTVICLWNVWFMCDYLKTDRCLERLRYSLVLFLSNVFVIFQQEFYVFSLYLHHFPCLLSCT